MARTWKRGLSLFLCLVMVLGLFPAVAPAAEAAEGEIREGKILFYDDFDGTALDATQWGTASDSGTAAVANGKLHLVPAANKWETKLPLGVGSEWTNYRTELEFTFNGWLDVVSNYNQYDCFSLLTRYNGSIWASTNLRRTDGTTAWNKGFSGDRKLQLAGQRIAGSASETYAGLEAGKSYKLRVDTVGTTVTATIAEASQSYEQGVTATATLAAGLPASGSLVLQCCNADLSFEKVKVTELTAAQKDTAVYAADNFETATDGVYGPVSSWTPQVNTLPATEEDENGNHYWKWDYSSHKELKANLHAADESWTDYTVEMDFRLDSWTGNTNWFCVALKAHFQNDQNAWQVAFRRDNTVQMSRFVGGRNTSIGAAVPFTLTPGTWYQVKLEFYGNTINCYAAEKGEAYGDPIVSYTGVNTGSTFGGLQINAIQAKSSYDNIRVTGPARAEDVRKQLTSDVAEAKAVNPTIYTQTSVAALNEAIAAAETVLAKTDATKAELSDAKAALETAVAGLERDEALVLVEDFEKETDGTFGPQYDWTRRDNSTTNAVLKTENGNHYWNFATSAEYYLLQSSDLEAYSVETDIRINAWEASGPDWICASLKGDFQDPDNSIYLSVRGKTGKIDLGEVKGSNKALNHGEKTLAVDTGTWYTMKMEFVGATVNCYIVEKGQAYGQPDLTYSSYTALPFSGVSLCGIQCDVDFDNVVVRKLPDPARVELEEDVAAAKALDVTGYTQTSVDALNAAIAAAETVLANADATKAELTKAKTDLEAAVAGLQPAQVYQYVLEDFEKETSGAYGPQYKWTMVAGSEPQTVAVEGGHAWKHTAGGSVKAALLEGNTILKDYAVEMEFSIDGWPSEGPHDSLSLTGHRMDNYNEWMLIVRRQSGKLELNEFYSNKSAGVRQEIDFVPTIGTWYKMKLAFSGNVISVYLAEKDENYGTPVMVYTDEDNRMPTGGICINGLNANFTLDNVKLYGPEDIDNKVLFPPKTFTMNKTEMRLSIGDSTSVSPIYELIADKGSAFTYASSDEAVAKVDNHGIITATGTGTATITCTAVDGAVATATVIVNPVCNSFYYVDAQNGSDSNPGTEAAPFKTIEKARDTIQGLTLPEGGVTVYLKGDFYLDKTLTFTPEDSGEAGKPIAYQSYDAKNPAVVHSGQTLTGWTKMTGNYPAGLPDAAKGQVYVTDVTPGWLFHDLYANGERQQKARLFNTDDTDKWHSFAKDSESPLYQSDEERAKGLLVHLQPGLLENVPSNGDVEMYLLSAVWWNGLPVVTDVDPENNTVRIQSFNANIEPNGIGDTLFQHGGKYNLYNAPKWIDEPGEWCVDSANGKLYWWPKNTNDLKNAVAPTLYELVRLQGDEEEQNWQEQVEYLEFRGITFQYQDRLPEDQWGKNPLNPGDLLTRNSENPDAAIFMQGVAHIVVADCRVLHTGSYAIALDHYAKDCRIVRNELGDLGCGGVQLYGYGVGSGKTWNINTRNVILANYIHHTGLAPYEHSSAITTFGSSYNDGKFNTIEYFPYTAIMLTGTDADSMNPNYTNRAGVTGLHGREYVDTYGNYTQYAMREDEILALGEEVTNGFWTRYNHGQGLSDGVVNAIPYQSSDYNIMEYNIAREYMMSLKDGGCYYSWSMGKNNEYNFNIGIRTQSWNGNNGDKCLYMDDYAFFIKCEGNLFWSQREQWFRMYNQGSIWKDNKWTKYDPNGQMPADMAALQSEIMAVVNEMGGYVTSLTTGGYAEAPALSGVSAQRDSEKAYVTVVTAPQLPAGAVKLVYEEVLTAKTGFLMGDTVSEVEELVPGTENKLVQMSDKDLMVYALDDYDGIVAYAYVEVTGEAYEPESMVLLTEDFEKETDGTYGPQNDGWQLRYANNGPTLKEENGNHFWTINSSEIYLHPDVDGLMDYAVETDVRVNSWASSPDYNCISLKGDFTDPDNAIYFSARGIAKTMDLAEIRGAAGAATYGEKAFIIETGKWYTMKMEFVGEIVKCYIVEKGQPYGEADLVYEGYKANPFSGVSLCVIGANADFDNIRLTGLDIDSMKDILEAYLTEVRAKDISLYPEENKIQLNKAIADAQDALNGDASANELLAAMDAVEAAVEAGDKAVADQQTADVLAAKKVKDQITAIGEVTLEDKAAIEAARTAYNALTDAQKALVDNYAALEAAEAELARLEKEAADAAAAKKVENLIAAIGEVTLDSEDAIEAAEAAYGALTDDQKALVTNHAALIAARETYNALKIAAENQAAADVVIAKIRKIGTVTLESLADIVDAEVAYAALTDDQKTLVTNHEDLTAARETYEALKAAADKLAADKAAAKGVDAKIEAIGTVTLDSKDAIEAARNAYTALKDDQEQWVTKLAELEAAEARLADLQAAKAVDTLIDLIGEVTLGDKAAIEAAEKAYDELTEEQQAEVRNYAKLLAARAEYNRQKAAADKLAADKEAAKGVDDLIDTIGEVDLESKDLIEAVRAAYEALTDGEKAHVTKLAELEAAEAEYARLKAQRELLIQMIIAGASNPQMPFTDVTRADWFYDEVNGAWQAGLINGITETTYEPNSSLTVAQAIKLAAALHQRNEKGRVTLKNGDTAWYSSYVEYAVRNKIIGAEYLTYSDGKMNSAVSRAEFVHILHGAMSYYKWVNNVADNAIPDVKTGSAYASEIYEFYRAGILTGSDAAGTFYPASSIKRSEVAAILIRMFDTSARQSVTLN